MLFLLFTSKTPVVLRVYLPVVFSLLLSCRGETASAPETDPLPLKTYRVGETTVKSYDFKKIEPFLHKENDTIYVVNFWATWCAPCVAELPVFEKLQWDYKEKKVKVILVSLDMAKDVQSKLIPFIIKKELKSKVIHLHDPDADSWINKVDPKWTGAIPATLIYGSGKRRFYEQSFSSGALDKELKLFIHN
jgi:thiol-disulfide isomerase/thioredoxin